MNYSLKIPIGRFCYKDNAYLCMQNEKSMKNIEGGGRHRPSTSGLCTRADKSGGHGIALRGRQDGIPPTEDHDGLYRAASG